jgi:2-polyprenyl-3-methyl-5-hydroxy-6-metoxy-1,4-benzoquinol methylase
MREEAAMPDWTKGYDQEFIFNLYRIFLGREPDPGGFQDYLSALNAGVPPHELVAALLHSEEYLARRRAEIIPQTRLPNLKEISPYNFEQDCYLAVDETRINSMEQLIATHHYYDNLGVWGSMIDFDKTTMAQLVQCTGATNCLEIGCFNGPVLSVLHERGLEVTGVEVSHLAFIIAFPNIRNALVYGDLLDIKLSKKFDCILLLDIMEHLNPLKINRYVRRLGELLQPNGLIIMNSPMFGDDPIFGTAFQQDRPQWQAIGNQDFFKHWPCDAMGWPLHGHMIWASPEWWTRQFANCDLIRKNKVERSIQDVLGSYFEKAPARRSLTVFGHREAAIEENRICDTIARQCWPASG